jgi:ABC-type sulfate/molybdate transport systems ATPase subunit
MVTGDLDLCVSSASDLVLLEAGRVVQRGDPRELLEAPESVEAARLLGIPNVFEATILALDPSRKSSRLDFGAWTLNGPHIPGHFRGDRVSIAVRPDALRVHSGKGPAAENCVPAALARISRRARYVRLEFEGGIFADVSHEEYARQKDNPGWQVEFPAGSLRVL